MEANEGVEIWSETQTLATITIQTYFRILERLSGMMSTAGTLEVGFHQILILDVLVVSTVQPVVRVDRNDLIFRPKREEFNSLVDEIERLQLD